MAKKPSEDNDSRRHSLEEQIADRLKPGLRQGERKIERVSDWIKPEKPKKK